MAATSLCGGWIFKENANPSGANDGPAGTCLVGAGMGADSWDIDDVDDPLDLLEAEDA